MRGEVEAAIALWALHDVRPVADTATSDVYRATAEDEQPVALKVLKPYGADEIVGAHLMQWYEGRGYARVLAIRAPAILMEWVDGTPLGDVTRAGRDDEATATLCEVVREFAHTPPGPLPALTPLRQQFLALFEADETLWPYAHRTLARRTTAIAAALFDEPSASVPLHGDLHHDNVVGRGKRWLAIDPKGLLGDPAYEVANTFRNPSGAAALALQPVRIDALADAFSHRLGLDRRRILRWAIAHAALSCCWDRARGDPIDWNLTILPVLFDALSRSE